jgi:hypothetical protein
VDYLRVRSGDDGTGAPRRRAGRRVARGVNGDALRRALTRALRLSPSSRRLPCGTVKASRVERLCERACKRTDNRGDDQASKDRTCSLPKSYMLATSRTTTTAALVAVDSDERPPNTTAQFSTRAKGPTRARMPPEEELRSRVLERPTPGHPPAACQRGWDRDKLAASRVSHVMLALNGSFKGVDVAKQHRLLSRPSADKRVGRAQTMPAAGKPGVSGPCCCLRNMRELQLA